MTLHETARHNRRITNVTRKNKSPEVRPLAAYTPPAYPSHQDPEPKAWLQVNPYPFGGTLAGSLALGALGLLGLGVGIAGEHPTGKPAVGSKVAKAPEFCAVCNDKSFTAGKGKCATCGGDSGSPQLKHCEKCAEKKSVCRMCSRAAKPPDHPFALKKVSRPVKPRPMVMGAVAMPMRLNERDARPVIDRLFAVEGIKVAKDTDPKLEGVTVELDGWDATRRIGYEYAAYGDVDHYGNQNLSKYSEKQRKAIEARRAKALSLPEMKQLEGLSVDKKAYVAVIEHERYEISHSGGNAAIQAKWKLWRAAKGNAARKKSIREEISKLQAAERLKAKQKVIEKLEKDVRGYIAWLKKQGAL